MTDGPADGRVFRQPGFALFWSAETVTEFGVTVTGFALQVFVVVTLGGTALDVGWLNAARWAPYLLFGIVLGALMDRRRRRPVMVWTDLGRFVVLAAIPLLWVAGWLSLPLLFVTVAVFGLLSLMNDSASQSFISRIVPRGALLSAHSRLDQSAAVAGTAGPLLAGWLVSLLAAPLVLVISAVTYLVSALQVWRIRILEPPARGGWSLRGLGGDIREGLHWVYRQRMLGALAFATHGWFLFNGMLVTVFVPFVLTGLGLGPVVLGAALAAAGVGSLLGATMSPRLGGRFGAGPVIIASRVILPLAWAAIVFATPSAAGVALLIAAQFVVGLCMGAENANEMAFRQVMTPDALQARVNTTMRSVNRGMPVIGAPLGGLIAGWIGFIPALLVAALGMLLVVVGLWLSPFRRARI